MVATDKQSGNGHKHGENPYDCPMFGLLSEQLQEQSVAKPHLWAYLHELPIQDIGVPGYAPVLGKQHKEMTRPNVVYPAGDGIFIHVMPDEKMRPATITSP